MDTDPFGAVAKVALSPKRPRIHKKRSLLLRNISLCPSILYQSNSLYSSLKTVFSVLFCSCFFSVLFLFCFWSVHDSLHGTPDPVRFFVRRGPPQATPLPPVGRFAPFPPHTRHDPIKSIGVRFIQGGLEGLYWGSAISFHPNRHAGHPFTRLSGWCLFLLSHRGPFSADSITLRGATN